MNDSDPSVDDLLAVAAFAAQFDGPNFTVGKWHQAEPRDDGVIVFGWWEPSEVVAAWNMALYDHHIIDPDSDYLAEDNVEFVKQAIEEHSLLANLDLPTLRRAVTFLARAERHTEGGWYDRAFSSGMAQAATRRLGELAEYR